MPRCEAEKATERIEENKTITEREILQIEVFLRKCVSTCSKLSKTLNKFLVDKKRREDCRNDPTPNEEDHKSQGKKRKKWFWSRQ